MKMRLCVLAVCHRDLKGIIQRPSQHLATGRGTIGMLFFKQRMVHGQGVTPGSCCMAFFMPARMNHSAPVDSWQCF